MINCYYTYYYYCYIMRRHWTRSQLFRFDAAPDPRGSAAQRSCHFSADAVLCRIHVYISLSLYIYIYIHIVYIYIYICIYTYHGVCIHISLYLSLYVYIYIYIYIYIDMSGAAMSTDTRAGGKGRATGIGPDRFKGFLTNRARTVFPTPFEISSCF